MTTVPTPAPTHQYIIAKVDYPCMLQYIKLKFKNIEKKRVEVGRGAGSYFCLVLDREGGGQCLMVREGRCLSLPAVVRVV
jgi:hypothetical protein